MMFKIWGLAFSLCFLNMIFATYHEHESEYNCSIDTVDNGVRDKMKLLLEDGKKVTFIHLVFINQTNPFSDAYRGDIYRPMNWVRIAGRHGRSLLFLRPEFEELSLTTLSLETGYIEVSLVQKPNNCLLHFNFTIIEDILRDLLLSDFKPGKNGGSLSEHEYICNMHIRNDNSNAKFFYRCCHKDPDGNVICQNLTYDYWIYVVFICVIVINVVAIMFSPYLIPDSFYRHKYGKIIYELRLLKSSKIKVTRIPLNKNDKSKHAVSIKRLEGMPSLHKSVKDILKPQSFSISKIHIAVQYRKLIPANSVPVGIINTFYTMFVKCNIRKTSTFKQCCRASLFGCQPKEDKTPMNGNREQDKADWKTVKAENPWYPCLKQFMRIVMLMGISIPWIIRIVFFYWYEKSNTLQRAKAAAERNMTLSFQWNLINTLTPMHILFLLCYAVIVIDALVFGIVSHSVKEKLQLLMRKCFRDMREMSISKALECSALVLVFPFEKWGIFGFLVFGFYLLFAAPIILGVLAFSCLPTLNLMLRLLVHFAYLLPFVKNNKTSPGCLQNIFKREPDMRSDGNLFQKMFDFFSDNESIKRPKTTENRFLQLFVLIACLSTALSVIVLTMEIVLFITELFIYTIIGIIMNASAMLKYISLIFMLVLYARDCFNGVSNKYLDFNKSINRLIVNEMREHVEETASLSRKDQKNTAFQVRFKNTTETVQNTKNVTLVVKDGTLKCRIHRLILFLDLNDKPYITERFFKSICYMDTAGVPGPLISNIVQATLRFLCICTFLMFVVLIVLAFGDEYQISGTNQMLATLVGGFLPWVFRNILFKSKESLELDTDNLSFKSNLINEIEHYVQDWEIADIEMIEENNRESSKDSTGETDDLLSNEEQINKKDKTISDNTTDDHINLFVYKT